MELEPFYTNFTFEEELKSPQAIQYQKKNIFFEFLFLWLEDSSKTLWTKFSYPQSYLEKIKTYKKSIPNITSTSKKPLLWWGNSRNILEKEINDKLTSFRARQELGLELEGSFVVNSDDDLQLLADNRDYLFKGAFGFSGREQVSDLKSAERLERPFLVEPKLNRIQDIGITFINERDYFCIGNFNDEKGQFKGALLLDDIPEHIVDKGRLIFDWYRREFSVEEIQIDMFSYLSNMKTRWNYLCEVNHRKTMGWVLWKLNSVFDLKYSAFKIIPKSQEINEKHGKETVVEISPPDHPMKVIYIGANTKSDLTIYLQNLS